MLKRNVAILTVALVVLGTGAYAWAQGAPERPTTSSVQPGTGQPKAERAARRMAGRADRAHRLGGRAVHGDLVVRGKDGFENVTFDKGEVVRHSATSITVKRADGVEVTKAVNGDTRFRGIESADEVVDGRPALVVSKGDAATVVGQRSGTPRR